MTQKNEQAAAVTALKGKKKEKKFHGVLIPVFDSLVTIMRRLKKLRQEYKRGEQRSKNNVRDTRKYLELQAKLTPPPPPPAPKPQPKPLTPKSAVKKPKPAPVVVAPVVVAPVVIVVPVVAPVVASYIV